MRSYQMNPSLSMTRSAYMELDKVELPGISSPLGKCHKITALLKKSSSRNNNNNRPIVINLEDTRYEVIERVCGELGWRIQYCSEGKTNWDIKWTDSYISSDALARMSSHQKINHFPGMITLFRKNNLAKNLKRMQQLTEQHYNFYPRTFLLPHDGTLLRSYISELRKNNIKKTFIVKPQANSQGRGIYLTQNIQQIDTTEHCVVQKYISNPLLFKGLKFDLRIYVLIAGCDPMRIYIYNEGLVRFATQKYQFPNNQNIDNLCMHLTNYAINKSHPNYIYNESTQDLSHGHKKSLAQFFRTLKSMGLKANYYWASIKDIIVKTLISGQPHLQHQYRISQPNNLLNNMCFEVLGFDFMIDGQHNCSLLQINHTPSFCTDTPLDDLIKSNLIKDTLLLMNINQKARQAALDQAKQIQQRRVLTGKVNRLTYQQRTKKVQQLQDQRQNFESQNLGSYQRIFPSKNPAKQSKYEQLLKISTQSYRQQSSGLKSSHKMSPSKKISSTKFRMKRMATNQTIINLTNSTGLYANPNINQQIDCSSKSINPQSMNHNKFQAVTAFDLQNPAKNGFGMTTGPFTRGKSLQSYPNVHSKKVSLLQQAKQINTSTTAQIITSSYKKCVSHMFTSANKSNTKFDMILPTKSTNNYSFTMFAKNMVKDAGSVPVKPIIQ